MDPNETLKAIRLATAAWEDGETTYMSLDNVHNFLDELMENLVALDEWLTNGGFRPDDWS